MVKNAKENRQRNKIGVRMFDFKSNSIHSFKQYSAQDLKCANYQALLTCSTCLHQFTTLTPSIYGDICKPCHQRFFAPRRICGHCKELKKRTLYYKNSPINAPLCPECYYRLVTRSQYATCKGCRRYRILADGIYCKACLKGKVACKVCGSQTFAGRELECENCSSKRLVLECAKFACLALPAGTLREDYMDFMQYLTNPRIAHGVYSNKQYPRYLQFFIDCKNLWGKIPPYETLVAHYKPHGLRSYLRILHWLIESKRIKEDLALKKYYSESERIITLKNKIPDPPFELSEYIAFLENKLAGGAKIGTIRAMIQPAVDLCVYNNLHKGDVIEAKHFDRYLKHRPGQKNLVWRFSTYIRENFGRKIHLSLTNGKIKPKTRNRTEIAEKIITKLVHKPSKLTIAEKREWFRCSMWLCHKQRVKKDPKVIDGRKLIKISQDGEFEYWYFNGQHFWLPIEPSKDK